MVRDDTRKEVVVGFRGTLSIIDIWTGEIPIVRCRFLIGAHDLAVSSTPLKRGEGL